MTGFLLAMLCFSYARAGESAKNESLGFGHCATLSPLKKAPTLDGKIEPGEWDNATRTVNFMDIFFNMMEPRGGSTYCGFYGDRLYIAMVSELPPRPAKGPYSIAYTRDADVVFDANGIEIWLDPNRDRRESQDGDQSFYQVILNTVGSIEDVRLTPGKSPDKGWNADVQSAHGLDHEKKLWTVEVSIPLKDLGYEPANLSGRSIGLLISRNYKFPWNQVTWFPHVNAFVSWQYYPRLYFTQDEPVVAIEGLGDGLFEAMPEFKLKLMNPGPARKAKVKLHITSSDMPDIKDEKEVDLAAAATANYQFKVLKEMLHKSAEHQVKIHVESADGAKTWFDYSAKWAYNRKALVGFSTVQRTADKKWDIRLDASPQESLGFALYPSYNQIRINLNAGMLVVDPDEADKDKVSASAKVTVADAGGKVLASADYAWDRAKDQRGGSYMLKLDNIPEGECTITAAFDKHSEPIVKKFTRKKFPFEGNTLGITETIYPPFEPVKAEGVKVAVVGREYEAGSLGLWKSVKSLGKELLAAPIVLKADGERVLTGEAKLAASKPMSATYEGTASDAAVTVKSRCTTEIDGCTKVELQLLPGSGKQELKSLALEIPLVDALAPLWHACTTQLRVNPVGATPAGSGPIWDSTKFPDGNWLGNFKCYLWLGGSDRGLCWFADNDRGWVLKYDEGGKNFAPSQELIRKDGVLTLRINLVQKPIIIDEPRSIIFGLMASPGKPMREDWRRVTFAAGLPKEFTGYPNIGWMGSEYWGADEVFASAYPRNQDMSLIEAVSGDDSWPGRKEYKEKGFDGMLKAWTERNFTPELPATGKSQEELVSLARVTLLGGGNTYFTAYWDEYHGDSPLHPERQIFNGEWQGNNMARSRQDFRCYWAAEFIKRNYGLYFDNSFPHACRDMLTSAAYELPGLGIQPSANLWAQRDYHRRIWNIHREFGAKYNMRPLEMVHMTNGNLITFLTWSDSTLDLEWFYGPEAQQSKYSPEMLRAQSGGRQTGCYPTVLAWVQGTKSAIEDRLANRTRLGVMAVHEIKPSFTPFFLSMYEMGYGKPECQVFNYWDENYPVKPSKPEAKTLLLKRGNELLLLVCTWDKQPGPVEFTFDTKALGVTPAQAEEAENELTALQQTIEKQRKELEGQKTEIARLIKEVEAKKAGAEDALKKTEAALAAKEKQLAGNESLVEVVKAASQPISYDASAAKLAVPLEGYGVRIIKLK